MNFDDETFIAEKMSDEVQMVIRQFHIVAMRKWIKSVNKGLGSIGYTFEKELGKSPDSLYFPDYYGTEIKCTGRYSRYPISLFTVAFDGPTFPEINRLIDKYGYPDVDYPDRKVIFSELSCVENNFVSSGYFFRLDVDDEEDKLYLCVYDFNFNLIERLSFVYFKSLYDHFFLKLNRLALVYASKKVMDNETYFRYYKTVLYRIKDFQVFLDLLKKGIIKVSLIARISKSSIDEGRYRNKNLVFKLRKNDLDKLFDEIYKYDYDGKLY